MNHAYTPHRDHRERLAALNDHVTRIEDADGKVLWQRVIQ
jgi:hypothetical protein